ncbi:MAG: thioredoxin family protein [SAR202 cluster bacterium]|nr:thioredoxin family protein [SAR202 cluster bacterium]
MPSSASVVTPKRFAAGLSYEEFLAQAKVNKDQFEANYKSAKVSDADAAAIKKLIATPGGPARVLVLGEDWCPDVYRGLPVIVRIAESTGMELKVFPRDKNLDIMNEYLKDGQFQSIPTVVFFTRETKYIAHWIERPVQANADRAVINEQIKKDMPSASEQDLRAESRKRTAAYYPAWQKETVKEIRALLEKAAR